MASEYYKWLARDVKPEEEKVLTREEKWNNWWYYHKLHVIIGILCLLFAANMGYDMWHNARNKPDYTIAYVGSTPLPDDTAEALELAFAGLGEDLNGNGRVQVELLSYAMPDDQTTSASMLLMLNIETVESMIFLLEDPEGFCATYPVLAGVDGTMPDETGDELQRWYRWADCPVLASLELGTFRIPLADGVAEGDSRRIMENICIARRGLWGDESSDTIRGALGLWEAMTAGAK